MTRLHKVCGFAALLGIVTTGALAVFSQGREIEWRYFGGDKAFTRYSPADQITRDNVKNLQIVWRRPAVDEKLTQAFPKMRHSGASQRWLESQCRISSARPAPRRAWICRVLWGRRQ